MKLHVPTAHLEAGLRSFNRQMPEEINRIVTDHCADLLLAPTAVAVEHLANEGLAERTEVVGDVMTDVLFKTKAAVTNQPNLITSEFGLQPHEYFLATIHRPANTDTAEQLSRAVASLDAVGEPVVLPAHPRLRAKSEQLGVELARKNLLVHDALAYPQLVKATMEARGVITDSGGLQKEAFLLRTPCTTVRPQTEWVETVELGWNVLVSPGEQLVNAALRSVPPATDAAPHGDGNAADAVIAQLQAHQH